jgi:hypothetical protein
MTISNDNKNKIKLQFSIFSAYFSYMTHVSRKKTHRLLVDEINWLEQVFQSPIDYKHHMINPMPTVPGPSS